MESLRLINTSLNKHHELRDPYLYPPVSISLTKSTRDTCNAGGMERSNPECFSDSSNHEYIASALKPIDHSKPRGLSSFRESCKPLPSSSGHLSAKVEIPKVADLQLASLVRDAIDLQSETFDGSLALQPKRFQSAYSTINPAFTGSVCMSSAETSLKSTGNYSYRKFPICHANSFERGVQAWLPSTETAEWQQPSFSVNMRRTNRQNNGLIKFSSPSLIRRNTSGSVSSGEVTVHSTSVAHHANGYLSTLGNVFKGAGGSHSAKLMKPPPPPDQCNRKSCRCLLDSAEYPDTMEALIKELYKEQILPAYEEVRRRLEKQKHCAKLISEFVEVCRDDKKYRFSVEVDANETRIFLREKPAWFEGFIDPNSSEFPYPLGLIPLLFFHFVDRYKFDPKGEAYRGGRFLLAELLKCEGPLALRCLTQGKLCHLLQKCLDIGFLSYESNSIRPAVACTALCKTYFARNCSSMKPEIKAEKESLIRTRLKMILVEHQNGLPMCRLPILYKVMYHVPLNIEDLGYTKLADFLQKQASDICIIESAARHRSMIFPCTHIVDKGKVESEKNFLTYTLSDGTSCSRQGLILHFMNAMKSIMWQRPSSYVFWYILSKGSTPLIRGYEERVGIQETANDKRTREILAKIWNAGRSCKGIYTFKVETPCMSSLEASMTNFKNFPRDFPVFPFYSSAIPYHQVANNLQNCSGSLAMSSHPAYKYLPAIETLAHCEIASWYNQMDLCKNQNSFHEEKNSSKSEKVVKLESSISDLMWNMIKTTTSQGATDISSLQLERILPQVKKDGVYTDGVHCERDQSFADIGCAYDAYRRFIEGFCLNSVRFADLFSMQSKNENSLKAVSSKYRSALRESVEVPLQYSSIPSESDSFQSFLNSSIYRTLNTGENIVDSIHDTELTIDELRGSCPATLYALKHIFEDEDKEHNVHGRNFGWRAGTSTPYGAMSHSYGGLDIEMYGFDIEPRLTALSPRPGKACRLQKEGSFPALIRQRDDIPALKPMKQFYDKFDEGCEYASEKGIGENLVDTNSHTAHLASKAMYHVHSPLSRDYKKQGRLERRNSSVYGMEEAMPVDSSRLEKSSIYGDFLDATQLKQILPYLGDSNENTKEKENVIFNGVPQPTMYEATRISYDNPSWPHYRNFVSKKTKQGGKLGYANMEENIPARIMPSGTDNPMNCHYTPKRMIDHNWRVYMGGAMPFGYGKTFKSGKENIFDPQNNFLGEWNDAQSVFSADAYNRSYSNSNSISFLMNPDNSNTIADKECDNSFKLTRENGINYRNFLVPVGADQPAAADAEDSLNEKTFFRELDINEDCSREPSATELADAENQQFHSQSLPMVNSEELLINSLLKELNLDIFAGTRALNLSNEFYCLDRSVGFD